jgi:hypothetical protein
MEWGGGLQTANSPHRYPVRLWPALSPPNQHNQTRPPPPHTTQIDPRPQASPNSVARTTLNTDPAPLFRMKCARSAPRGQSRLAGRGSSSSVGASSTAGRPRHAASRRTHVVCRAATVQTTGPQSGLQQLLSWASQSKIALDKVATAADVSTGQAILVAARDVAAGEQVLAVPDSAWVTPATAQQSSIGKHVAGLEPWLQLALLLLAERAKPGGSGPGQLQALLSTAAAAAAAGGGGGGGSNVMRSPLFWSEAELQLLQGTQLLESARGYK